MIPKKHFDSRLCWIDNGSRNQFYAKTATISDITALTTVLLSAGAMFIESRSTLIPKAMVFTQSIWISANASHTIKMLTHRARPYTREPGFQYAKRDDFYSLISGHSAIIAATTTSAWCMRNRKNGVSSFNGQNILLLGAGLLTLKTDTMRVRAGKHHPSDVIAGCLTGMGIAWINYRIHEK